MHGPQHKKRTVEITTTVLVKHGKTQDCREIIRSRADSLSGY